MAELDWKQGVKCHQTKSTTLKCFCLFQLTFFFVFSPSMQNVLPSLALSPEDETVEEVTLQEKEKLINISYELAAEASKRSKLVAGTWLCRCYTDAAHDFIGFVDFGYVLIVWPFTCKLWIFVFIVSCVFVCDWTCCSVSLQWKACRNHPLPFHSLLTHRNSLTGLTSCVCSSTSKGIHQHVLSMLIML